jgi:hypothetical protein
MYYSNTQEDELGFDAFIAPDGFDHTAQPVDIYTKFKEWYPIDSKAKYIYYYSDGNYPLTLTPTADEYYKYGYTQGGVEVMGVDVPLNGTAVTIFNETVTTKRWVIVYRVSSAKFLLAFEQNTRYVLWVYCGTSVNGIRSNMSYGIGTIELKYVHFANLNSITSNFNSAFYDKPARKLTGTITFPESMTSIGGFAFWDAYQLLTKLNLPNTKNLELVYGGFRTFNYGVFVEANFGASTSLSGFSEFSNAARISVSPQNTAYASFDYCDIIYTKDKTILYWLAPKTVRGLTLPDELPQAQITALGTKFSLQQLQGYQLYIGTLITDLTNLYLSNKSFSTVEVGVGNTAFKVENNILYNTTKTELIKAGTNNTGSLVIDNAVTTIKSGAFLRCVGYTGGLTIPDTVTSIVANSFAGLSGLTGNLVIGNGVTSIVANSFAGVTNLAGSLTIPTTITTIEPSSISGLKNLTGDLIFTGGQWNLSTYSYFGFANFTATSIKSIIDNDKLVNGTVGSPKNFYISKTTYDALVALSGGQASIDLAASRYINVKANYIIQDGLKLWLDASDPSSYPGTGTTWYDLSGNDNNGTMVNGVVPLSNAMSFDGANDYVNCGSNTILVNSSVVCSLWFKTITTGIQRIIFKSKDNSNVNPAYELYIISGVLHFNLNGTGAITVPISINTWYNVAGVYDYVNKKQRLCLNGIFITETTKDIILPITEYPLGIGRNVYYTDYPFIGLINDIAIYNRALTADEVLQNFNSTRYKYGI